MQPKMVVTQATTAKYSPQGSTLKEFHAHHDDFVRVLIGPLGSGKTQACIFEILRQIDSQIPDDQQRRRSRWVIARNTQPEPGGRQCPAVGNHQSRCASAQRRPAGAPAQASSG